MVSKLYIRIITTLFIGGFLTATAMEQSQVPALTPAQIQAIQTETQQALQDMQTSETIEAIMQEIDQDKAPTAAAPLKTGIPQIDELTETMGSSLPAMPNLDQERQRAQDQNTVLLKHPKVPVALYKRDLYELPFFAADIAIAYAGFHVYKQNRTEHLYKTLTQQTDSTIETLQTVQSLRKQRGSKTLATSQEITQKEIYELWETIGTQHAYIGYNPFKLDMLMPLITTMVGHAASAYAQNKVILKHSFVPEAQFAYTKNADGSYKRFELDKMYTPSLDDYEALGNEINTSQDPASVFKTIAKIYGYIGLSSVFWSGAPISTLSALKGSFIGNPNTQITDNLPDIAPLIPDEALEKGFYKLTGLPDWLYTIKNAPATRYATEAIVFGQILTLIDRAYHGAWMQHMATHTDELITLLKEYQATKDLSHKHPDKQRVQEQLKQFIATGTTITSWHKACQDLFNYKAIGRMTVQHHTVSWLTTAISASLLWKSRTPMRFIYNGAKTGMISPEVLLIGGIVTLYYVGLGFGPLVAISAHTVYQDIKHVVSTAKNYLVKKWQYKKEEKQEAIEQEKPIEPNIAN